MELQHITIVSTDIETVVAISKQIPEFESPHDSAEYTKRLAGKQSLLLAAYVDGAAAGFKVGYDKYGDGSFYSWMGGVLPQYRKKHVAKMLADHQEKWALAHGYKTIRFKTRNRHKSMLLFALSNDFSITGLELRETIAEHRIMLEKKL